MNTLIAKNPEATSPTIATELKRKNILVSARTVRRKLASNGMVFGNTMSKPLLSEEHCEKRLKWAKANKATDWKQVLFTDEATINCGTRRKRVWHRPGKKVVIRTVKHPVKMHIWGCVRVLDLGSALYSKRTLELKSY